MILGTRCDIIVLFPLPPARTEETQRPVDCEVNYLLATNFSVAIINRSAQFNTINTQQSAPVQMFQAEILKRMNRTEVMDILPLQRAEFPCDTEENRTMNLSKRVIHARCRVVHCGFIYAAPLAYVLRSKQMQQFYVAVVSTMLLLPHRE